MDEILNNSEDFLEEQDPNLEYPTEEELFYDCSGEDEEVEPRLATASYTPFTVRESKPTKKDKFAKCYIRKASGGWSGAIVGKPTDKECNVLSNCVG